MYTGYPRKFAKLTKYFCLNALLCSRDPVRPSCPVRESAHSTSWVAVPTQQTPLQIEPNHSGARPYRREFRISSSMWSLILSQKCRGEGRFSQIAH